MLYRGELGLTHRLGPNQSNLRSKHGFPLVCLSCGFLAIRMKLSFHRQLVLASSILSAGKAPPHARQQGKATLSR